MLLVGRSTDKLWPIHYSYAKVSAVKILINWWDLISWWWLTGGRAGGLCGPNGQLRVAAPDEFRWKIFYQVLHNFWKQFSWKNCGLWAIASQTGSCWWKHPTKFDERFFTRFFKFVENNIFEKIVIIAINLSLLVQQLIRL